MLQLAYYGGYRCISSIKPACYFCYQYIRALNIASLRNRTPTIVEPPTDYQIYVDWRAPGIECGSKDVEARSERRKVAMERIMNSIINDAKEFLRI